MSQVVVEEDKYSAARNRSQQQEQQIKKNQFVKKWKMPPIKFLNIIRGGFVVILAPVMMLWAVMVAGGGLAFGLCLFLFKVLGGLIPRRLKRKEKLA